MNPLISFVVPAFGKPDTLRTCLSSLMDQTMPLLEVIVVDNTPDNDTAAKNRALTWMDPRIKYEWTSHRCAVNEPGIRHSHCLYTATEIGVGMAMGEWLAFPSQDDYACPVFAERMLLVASETAADFVHCDVVLGGPGHGYFTLNTAPRNCAIDKCSFIMKKSWFEGFSGKHENYELEDGFFVERLIAKGIRYAKCAQVLMLHN